MEVLSFAWRAFLNYLSPIIFPLLQASVRGPLIRNKRLPGSNLRCEMQHLKLHKEWSDGVGGTRVTVSGTRGEKLMTHITHCPPSQDGVTLEVCAPPQAMHLGKEAVTVYLKNMPSHVSWVAFCFLGAVGHSLVLHTLADVCSSPESWPVEVGDVFWLPSQQTSPTWTLPARSGAIAHCIVVPFWAPVCNQLAPNALGASWLHTHLTLAPMQWGRFLAHAPPENRPPPNPSEVVQHGNAAASPQISAPGRPVRTCAKPPLPAPVRKRDASPLPPVKRQKNSPKSEPQPNSTGKSKHTPKPAPKLTPKAKAKVKAEAKAKSKATAKAKTKAKAQPKPGPKQVPKPTPKPEASTPLKTTVTCASAGEGGGEGQQDPLASPAHGLNTGLFVGANGRAELKAILAETVAEFFASKNQQDPPAPPLHGLDKDLLVGANREAEVKAMAAEIFAGIVGSKNQQDPLATPLHGLDNGSLVDGGGEFKAMVAETVANLVASHSQQHQHTPHPKMPAAHMQAMKSEFMQPMQQDPMQSMHPAFMQRMQGL